MPSYVYECKSCLQKALKKYELSGTDITYNLPQEIFESEVLFETYHRMHPTESELFGATECPRCLSHNCEKSLYGSKIHCYIRGYGWLDKSGARRDMHKHTLQNNDPYKQHRAAGEADHIGDSLEKAGKHDPKTKYFTA